MAQGKVPPNYHSDQKTTAEYDYSDDRSEILGKLFSMRPEVLTDPADQASWHGRELSTNLSTMCLVGNFIY